jgi:hypothetical protein
MYARRSPGRAVAIAAGIAIVWGIATFGAGRASRPIDQAAARAGMPSATMPNREARDGPAAPPSAAEADPNAMEGDPPLVMDLPSTPGEKAGAERTRAAKNGAARPQRPKFLNTRE